MPIVNTVFVTKWNGSQYNMCITLAVILEDYTWATWVKFTLTDFSKYFAIAHYTVCLKDAQIHILIQQS